MLAKEFTHHAPSLTAAIFLKNLMHPAYILCSWLTQKKTSETERDSSESICFPLRSPPPSLLKHGWASEEPLSRTSIGTRTLEQSCHRRQTDSFHYIILGVSILARCYFFPFFENELSPPTPQLLDILADMVVGRKEQKKKKRKDPSAKLQGCFYYPCFSSDRKQ